MDDPMQEIDTSQDFSSTEKINGNVDALRATLRRIDGAGYKAYHDILGGWSFPDGSTLFVDKIQADPFAPPSRCHLRVPAAVARFPAALYSNRVRAIALGDFLARAFCGLVKRGGLDQAAGGAGWSGPKGGDLQMDAPGQQVRERACAVVREIGALPAASHAQRGPGNNTHERGRTRTSRRTSR
jgi:hypothetical protein